MNRIQRKRYKLLYRILTAAAYACIAFFITGFVILLTVKIDNPVIRWSVGITTLASPFIGLIVLTFATMYGNTLTQFRKRIREYRIRVVFQKICVLIDKGDLRTALEYYNGNYIPEGHSCRDYLYTLLIHKCLECNDPELVEKGRFHVDRTRNFYSPYEVDIYQEGILYLQVKK